jgi:enoyl-CoA hydratase/carnithine racemase
MEATSMNLDFSPASEIVIERRGSAGLITLNRPKALNALSLQMVRDLRATLLAWQVDPKVTVVAIRGTNKTGRPGTPDALFGGFCAGGDIRFFHQAVHTGEAGEQELEAFFTEEYQLNHLIHTYPKPYIAFMDGVVMGGGMGISQGARVRIVTERTKMAMPETNIGLFPDVGGGYFLSRCPGHVGEYLALTGHVMGADEALAYGLADVKLESTRLAGLWDALGGPGLDTAAQTDQWLATNLIAACARPALSIDEIDACFGLLRVKHIIDALERSTSAWAKKTAVAMRRYSPLMLHVTLEQIRKARALSLADTLRMERDMVYRCFHPEAGTRSEAVEGIRALVIDKDYSPKWTPARIEDVKPGMTDAFFASPWAADAHPLRDL